MTTRLKICGVTRAEDAALVAAAGVELLGLNFWPRSKRYLAPARAAPVAAAARAAGPVQLVGVFVDATLAEIAAALAQVELDAIQLHGDEPPEFVRAVAAATNRPVWKALAAGASPAPLELAAWPAEAIVLDAPTPGRGGGGVPFDWAIAQGARARHPAVRLVLAGGLSPDNVAAAIAAVAPWAVDVASGVESAPGVKDPARLAAFIAAARAATPRDPAGSSGARGHAIAVTATAVTTTAVTAATAVTAVTAVTDPGSSRRQHPMVSTVEAIARLPAPERGRFGETGEFGGQYVAETLMPALAELEAAWRAARADATFWAEIDALLTDYVGRPSRLYHARRLSAAVGATVYLKREDLNHTGAHKINNCIGQAVLARRMGKRRLIAETGAGQHGVATATIAALFDLPCEIYMGAEDVVRQALNVERMRLLGATVHPVESGTRTLKDAMNEALRDWVTNVGDTFYLIGSVAGPHPYPWLVRDLQSVIGREAREQILAAAGRLPDALVACVGGGSNAGGLFAPFVPDAGVRCFGVEAAGDGVETGRHAATLGAGRVGVLHGSKSYVLTQPDGQIAHAHSISAGLDYPGVGPEHAAWSQSGRATYLSRTDAEALAGLERLARTEGILCALETAHAIAALDEVAAATSGGLVIVGLSGRGDKDMVTVAAHRAGGRP